MGVSMSFISVEEILDACAEKKLPFWEVILQSDMEERGASREASLAKMNTLWDTMYEADKTYNPLLTSASGISGGDGGKMKEYADSKASICGGFLNQVITCAIRMGESNCCMRRIVAAPTAGACGVLPAVLIPYWETYSPERDSILEALYVSAGIGQVIAARATIAGASGGCQAEIGSASAMAAASLVCLHGGTKEQMAHAAAIALKSLLGLVCDPVAGLVEVPCIKRNVIGAVNALSSAEMALAGIKSRIPVDQVIDAMKEIGDKMDVSLRETGAGGLAGTPEGIRLRKQVP